MRAPLAGWVSRVLVGWHPRRWRERYGEEMLDVLDQHHPTARTVVSLWASAVGAQLDRGWRTDRLSLSRLRRAAAMIATLPGSDFRHLKAPPTQPSAPRGAGHPGRRTGAGRLTTVRSG